jgi:hypothetical protein
VPCELHLLVSWPEWSSIPIGESLGEGRASSRPIVRQRFAAQARPLARSQLTAAALWLGPAGSPPWRGFPAYRLERILRLLTRRGPRA